MEGDTYDYIIIGGGIAGLTSMYYLGKQKHKILMLERMPRLGGKIYSEHINFKGQKHIFEKGAVRFHNKQTHMLQLIEDVGLKKDIIKYPSEITRGDNLFPLLNQISRNILEANKERMLNLSFIDYVNKYETKSVANKIKHYTYYETLEYGNAYYIAKYMLSNYDTNLKYMTLKNGMSSLIAKIEREISLYKKSTILKEKMVSDVKKKNDYFQVFLGENGEIYCSKNIIFALPSKYLSKFSLLNSKKNVNEAINGIHYRTLNRIYAVFPKSEKTLFEEKVITSNGKLKTSVMFDNQKSLISYCDGKCAKKWFKINMKEKLKSEVEKEVKKLDSNYKTPLKVWNYYWPNSLGIWKKGIDFEKMQKHMLQPRKNVFVCGDSFSLHQCWMEGAILTAKEIVNMSKNRKSIKTRKMKGGKANKKYTMQQVAKHNKKEDGWLVINKKVYDVTTWIDKHPGGAVIENYLGRDATNAFKSIGHPEYVMKTILPKYYIGMLQDKTRKNN